MRDFDPARISAFFVRFRQLRTYRRIGSRQLWARAAAVRQFDLSDEAAQPPCEVVDVFATRRGRCGTPGASHCTRSCSAAFVA